MITVLIVHRKKERNNVLCCFEWKGNMYLLSYCLLTYQIVVVPLKKREFSVKPKGENKIPSAVLSRYISIFPCHCSITI